MQIHVLSLFLGWREARFADHFLQFLRNVLRLLVHIHVLVIHLKIGIFPLDFDKNLPLSNY